MQDVYLYWSIFRFFICTLNTEYFLFLYFSFKWLEYLLVTESEGLFQVRTGKVWAGVRLVSFQWLQKCTTEAQRDFTVWWHYVEPAAEPNPTSHLTRDTDFLNTTWWNARKTTDTQDLGERAPRLHRLQWQQTIAPYQLSAYEATGRWQTWRLRLKFCTSVHKMTVTLM